MAQEKSLDDLVKEIVAGEWEKVRVDIMKDAEEYIREQLEELANEITEIFGENDFGKVAGNVAGQAFSDLLKGKKITIRNLASTAARAFAPSVDDFFRQSGSQAGDAIRDLLNFSGRNI